MSLAPISTGLRTKQPRARARASTPSYPALLCLAVASAATACSSEPWPDEPADAQTDASTEVSDAELSDPEAGGAEAGQDEVQLAGCSATVFRPGPKGTALPGALAIAGVIAAGVRCRRRR